jgi:hypothetical protein
MPMSDTPVPPAAASSAPSPANLDAAVLAASHRFNLVLVQRMPYDLEYAAPQEILQAMRLCNVYGVDWTPGLEPKGVRDEEVQEFLVPRPAEYGTEWIPVHVRVRLEELVQDPAGVWVPDGGIVWFMQLLGRLQRSIERAIQASGGI